MSKIKVSDVVSKRELEEAELLVVVHPDGSYSYATTRPLGDVQRALEAILVDVKTEAEGE